MTIPKNPIISVIIPVYNIRAYLSHCLESLMTQTFPYFEVLCIDDSSDDDSAQIIKQYQAKDARIHLLQQPHTGVSTARNTGICHARGKYILFVDGDDWLEKEMFEKMLRSAEETACDMVICSAQVHFVQQNSFCSIRRQKSLQKALTVSSGLWNSNHSADSYWSVVQYPGVWPFVWNKLIRSDLIKKHEIFFPTNLSLGEDGVFILFLLQYAKSIVFLPDQLYHYRYQRKGSATVTTFQDTATRFYHHINVVQTMFDVFSKQNALEHNGQQLLEWTIHFLYGDFVILPTDVQKEVVPALGKLLREYPILFYANRLDFIMKKRLDHMMQGSEKCTRISRFLNIFQTKLENRIMYIRKRKT